MKAYFYPTLKEFRKHDWEHREYNPDEVAELLNESCIPAASQDEILRSIFPVAAGKNEVVDFGALTNKVLEECYQELQKSAGFVWRTHKGVDMRPCDMATPHLFYSLRMIWNNVVPPAFRVGKFKRYNDVGEWTDVYLEQATNALLTELLTREDEVDEVVSDSPTGETIHEQLCDLVMNCGALWTLSGGEGDPLDEAGGSGRAE